VPPKQVQVTRIISVRPGVEALAVRRARIKVVRGPDKGKEALLGERRCIVIGTDPDADLVLSDDAVSRRHAELRAEPEGYLLRDLGSTNGIHIGEARVEQAILGAKALVELGSSALRFTPLDEEVQHPLSQQLGFGKVLGRSLAMRELFAKLELSAASDATVLLEGESGTGKEIVAESLHERSSRADGPFVVVDCAALPAGLIESELFGHEKGAFTGATAARAGAFEAASGGTLFLDEVGELPLELQQRFLGALERQAVRRVGGAAPLAVDVRVIAATHRNLEQLVRERRFRDDLYFRLAVVKIALPPLRHRREDIALLARHFAADLRPSGGESALTEGVLQAFAGYAWPGNVREVRNAVESLLTVGEAPLSGGRPAPLGVYHLAKQSALERFERDYCRSLLAECGGVVARAAERSGISRQMFHRLLHKHGLGT
jgi:transcriptional regulator with GAF, ATPase, and Fis domain